MSTTTTIDKAQVEAAARAIHGRAGLKWSRPFDELSADTRDTFIGIARAALTAAAQAGKDGHDYLSTACHHGLHDRCRKSCKFCSTECRCGCHEGERVEPSLPAAERTSSLSASRQGEPSPAPAPLGRADDGLVLVPKVPTEEMLNGARDWSLKKNGRGVGNDQATGCYQAMLAAAPSPPVQSGEAEDVAARMEFWVMADQGTKGTHRDDDLRHAAKVIRTLTQALAEARNGKLQKRPVAWRVATTHSWAVYQSEEMAADHARQRGIEYQGLYVRDGEPGEAAS